jgi:hypothetical protein
MVRDRTQGLFLGEYEQEILENALEESLDKVIQLFEADIDELEACITTTSSGNPKQNSNMHLNSKNPRLESWKRSEAGLSFVHANGQSSPLPSAGFRKIGPQPLAITPLVSSPACDEIIGKPPSIRASAKAIVAPNPAVTCPIDFRGTLPEKKRVSSMDTTIKPGHFRNGTDDPFLSNFFDDDRQQLDSLFDITYLWRNGCFEDTGWNYVRSLKFNIPYCGMW